MKFSYSLLIAFFISSQLVAQADSLGIRFIHDNYREALAKAKAENKIIFIDCFTTWCGPCKMMARTTFMDSAVADYFNKNFVNLKLDMEKGEGPAVQQKNGITAFPTLLFLNSEGESVHKAIGFQEAEQFLEIGTKASSSYDALSTWTKKYEGGNNDPVFLHDYALKLYEVMDLRRQTVALKYFKTQSNTWKTPDNLDFIFRFTESCSDTFFYTLAHNRKIFESHFTAEEIQNKIKTTVDSKLYNNQDLASLGEADTLISLVQPKNLQRTQLNYRLTYYRMKGDRDNYAIAAVNYLKKYDDRADELAENAFTFNEQIENTKHLKAAVKWAQHACKLQPSVNTQMTLVHLYQKLHKNKKAIAAALDALAIGKKTGESLVEVQNFLKTSKM